MDIGDKAAQLLMVEFVGSDGSMALEYLEGHPVGGFLLKSANGNLISSVQLREMISLLQGASEIPLFIAVDQEGGRIDRIRFDDFRRFPSAEVFGLLNDPELTERASWATGVQLAALGVNVDFAPVADVNVLGDLNPAIGDRSFGSDPDLVAAMVAAAVRGFNRAGIAAAVKHFPGHGNTAVDSHLGLPVILTPSEEWAKTDRVPFETSIEAGVPMVMVGHVAYPALDADGLPASLSRAITYGQLRSDLGFTGVIVTDDLANMGAVAAWTPAERAVRALMAGSDLILNPADVAAAVSAIEEAVADDRVSEQAVDGALARLLGLKFDLRIVGTDSNGALGAVLVEAVASVGQEVADACLTAGLDC
jgi:beta-N-acetylhexosaminidase